MASATAGPGLFRGLAFSGSPAGLLYLRPHDLTPAQADATALRRLAGGPLGFNVIELALRDTLSVTRATATIAETRAWAVAHGPEAQSFVDDWLDRLSTPVPPMAGLSLERPTLDRPRIMGIVNVTPDSFSDGGAFVEPDKAIAHGRELSAAGADILDVGGESTRPGAAPTAEEEQVARVLPVIEGLVDTGACISVDTRSAKVMQAAVAAGAALINDVSALGHDPAALEAARDARVPIVLTHMRGTPGDMRDRAKYTDVALDVFDELAARIDACEKAGIPRARLIVDPGFGFAKNTAQNAELLGRLGLLHGLGCAVAVGTSRKTFTPEAAHVAPGERLGASLAAAVTAAGQGAQIFRVHDVAETRQALDVWRAAQGKAAGSAQNEA